MNKLNFLSEEISDKIATEIGVDKFYEINIDFFSEYPWTDSNKHLITLSDLPKLKKEDKVSKKKTAEKLQEIKQYFENNHILQINEHSRIYTIWYANGNIKEVPDWNFDAYDLMRSYFFNFSSSSLSLHELNNSPRLLKKLNLESDNEKWYWN